MTTQADPSSSGSPIPGNSIPAPRRAWVKMAVQRSELLALIREDLQTHQTMLAPGFHALVAARVGHWADSADLPSWKRVPARAAASVGYQIAKNVYGIELPHTVKLGRRVTIAHQHGIVIHPNSTLGDDVVIRQGVTLGGGRGDDKIMLQAPQIGAGVSLGAGACVVGRVTIGAGATIGPNAVVMTNVPQGATVLAQPPRVIRVRTSAPSGKPHTGEGSADGAAATSRTTASSISHD